MQVNPVRLIGVCSCHSFQIHHLSAPLFSSAFEHVSIVHTSSLGRVLLLFLSDSSYLGALFLIGVCTCYSLQTHHIWVLFFSSGFALVVHYRLIFSRHSFSHRRLLVQLTTGLSSIGTLFFIGACSCRSLQAHRLSAHSPSRASCSRRCQRCSRCALCSFSVANGALNPKSIFAFAEATTTRLKRYVCVITLSVKYFSRFIMTNNTLKYICVRGSNYHELEGVRVCYHFVCEVLLEICEYQ